MKELKSELLDVHAIIPKTGPLQVELEKNNISYDIVELSWWANKDEKKLSYIMNDWSDNLNNLVEFMPRLIRLEPDLLYTNTITFPWGAIAAQYIQKPHIWHIREFGDLDHKLKFDVSYQEIIRFIENNSDAVICNSQAVGNHISLYLESKKPNVVYNYVDFDKKLLDKPIVNPYLQKDSLKMLVCGTLHEGKNQLEAIKALHNLIDDNHKAELVLLGSKEDKAYIDTLVHYAQEKKIYQYVHIIDFTTNPYPYFQAADVVLIPSHHEAYGRTAIEAMILGKPVVASAGGGIDEIIKNNVNGCVYPDGDLDSLQKILIKLGDAKMREVIGEKGRQSLDKINKKAQYGQTIHKIINETISHYNPHLSLDTLFSTVFVNDALYKRARGETVGKSEELERIKNSRLFKLWPLYCKIKKWVGR